MMAQALVGTAGALASPVSGASVLPDISKDIEAAEDRGKQAKDVFIDDRLKRNEGFFTPLTKQKLKTFADLGKMALVETANNKIIQYKQQGNVAFTLFVKSHTQKLNLQELLRYPLIHVPSCIGTSDGHLLKMGKSKGFHSLVKDMKNACIPPGQDTMNIEDRNAVFHSMKETPITFKPICQSIMSIAISGKLSVIFSTDSYIP